MEDLGGSTLISGVGDEVVFFVLLLATLVLLLILYFSRSSSSTQARPRTGTEEDIRIDDEDNLRDTGNAGQETHQVRQRGRVHQSPTSHEGPLATSDHDSREEERNSSAADTILSINLVTLNRTWNISVSETTTLQQLQQDYFQRELNERRRIRFIYQGRVMTDLTTTLFDNNIRNNSSLHVHIGPVEVPNRQENQDTVDDGMLDLSFLFLPLIGLMLGIVWTCFLIWPHVFSFPAKFILFILSLSFAFFFYHSHLS